MKLRFSKMAALSLKGRRNPALRGRCIRRWWDSREGLNSLFLWLAFTVSICLICPPHAFAAGDRLVFGLQAAYGLENGIPRNISHIQMLYAQPQIGYVVWNSPDSRLPVKRFDIVSEGMLGGSTHPGGHLFGDMLMFRVTGNSARRFTPFFDVSSGPLHTTLNEHASELGGHVQFLSQGGAGILRGLDARRSIVLEYRYFHMSNAGLTKPNHGFNGSLLSIGVRWNTR
jgi:hypothetical protein